MAAALMLGISLGGLGGWFLHEAGANDRLGQAIALLENEALSAHAVYSVDSHHAVEVAGTEREQLAQWLSKRLNRTITPPELSAVGYELMGGRLLATERGSAAAMLMHENSSGRRLSIVLRPMTQDMYAPRFDISQGQTNGCGWIEKGLGYAVVAALPDNELDRIAEQIKAEQAKWTG
jgi:anti-sigma factor RsiW